MSIYERILDCCRRAGTIPIRLCDEAGVPRSVISMMKAREEAGVEASISTKNILRIAKALNVSIDYLLTGQDFGFDYTYEEQQLVQAYRKADDDARENVCFALRKFGMSLPQEETSSALKTG